MPQDIIKSDDYFSFAQIKAFIIDIFRFIFYLFRFVVTSIQRSFLLFAVCCIIGLTAGYIYYTQSQQYFKSEMIVRFNDLSRRTYYEIIKNLNGLLVSQSYSNFANQMNIDSATANKILLLDVVGLNNESLRSDTSTKTNQPIKILIKARTSTVIPIFQDAILNYLNNNPYLVLVKEGQKKISQEKLKFIDKEQQRLDSLKIIYNNTIASMKMPSTFYNNALDPAEIYDHSLKLSAQRDSILKWLNNESKGVILVDGFKVLIKPESTGLVASLLLGFALGALLGVIASLFSALMRIVS